MIITNNNRNTKYRFTDYSFVMMYHLFQVQESQERQKGLDCAQCHYLLTISSSLPSTSGL